MATERSQEFILRFHPHQSLSASQIKDCAPVINAAATLIPGMQLRDHSVRGPDGKMLHSQSFPSHAEEAAPVLAVRLNPEGFKLRPGIANFLDEFLPKVLADEAIASK